MRLWAQVTLATFILVAAVLLVGVQLGLASERVCGRASWYSYTGHRTANHERFNGSGLTAAMISSSHIGERWRVTYVGTQKHPGTFKSVVVRINDTGGFAKYGRIIDLSKGAAAAIGLVHAGVGVVCAERLQLPHPK